MSLLSIPRERTQRRRFFKRVTNAAMICAVSGLTAWLITRQTGGTGFNPPAAARETLLASGKGAISVAAIDPAITPAGYKLPAGPYKVSEVGDIVLHDAARDKDLHVRVFYPQASGRYPVIVFSHGAGGSENCCEALTQHWASYGYVTIQPTHDDSAVQRRNAGEENVRFMQAVRDALRQPALWESRPKDISFVLDTLSELAKRVAGLTGKMDERHIGVGGHSMGSFTTEAIAGARVDLPGKGAVSFADRRVKAAMCLSPQGPGQFGLSADSFREMRTPFLGITGSQDSLGPLASPAWHKQPFALSPAGDKFFVDIEGANHMSFITSTMLAPGKAQQAANILDYTNSAALAFWDAYLKNDAAAKEYLQSDGLTTFSKGAAKLDRR